jgi:hypothetical protein
VAFGYGGAEGGQVRFFQVASRGVDVEAVAHAFRAGVHGKVLAGSHGAQMLQVLALHSVDKGYAQSGGQEWVFAVGFLAAAPAGIAKDVDVGRPEGQSIEDAVVALALRLVVLGAGFGGDDVAHGVDDRGVPGGGHADGLGKDGGVAGAGDAMQGFVPGLVVGNAEAGNGSGPIFKLTGFFVQGHSANQVVGALCRGKVGVEIRGLLRLDERGEEGDGERE